MFVAEKIDIFSHSIEKKEFCTAANDYAMRSAESDEVNQALASVKSNFRWKVFCALVSARNENEMITDFNA